jgi:hypothetical protein
MSTVYILKNTVNEKVYIGATTRDLKTRLREHKSRARKGVRRYELYEEMRNIGIDNFFIEPLCENVPDGELSRVELEYINNHDDVNNLLNTVLGFSYSLIQQIITDYKNGRTLQEISLDHGKCKKQLSQILKLSGIPIRDWNGEQRANVSFEELHKMYCADLMTTYQIADVIGVSAVTIGKHLRKHGIPLRPSASVKRT